MKILVINAGSSSLKYQLINMDTSAVMAKGVCERIGVDGAITHKTEDGRVYKKNEIQKDHKDSIELVIRLLTGKEYGVIESIDNITAVGHRMVHGGKISESKLLDDELMMYLESVSKFAPLHNPPILKVMSICRSMFGDTPQCAVFDTAFHASMEEHAYLYALPYEYYEKHNIRKYGFHGTSHKYVSNQAANYLKKDLKDLKIVSCHLGNGSSITAVQNGKSVDTSMGFTPLDGLMMGTRCGSIDPAIILHFIADMGMDVEEVNQLINKKSGLAGLSGISNDMRDLEKAASEGHKLAKTTITMLEYQIKKFIGAYAAAMNGMDVLLFTAGIGENTPMLRKNVCDGISFMGVSIDNVKNTKKSDSILDISGSESKVKVLVVPTNEEYAIALDTLALVQ